MSSPAPTNASNASDPPRSDRPRRVHVVFWFYARRRDMVLKPHHVRDGSALFELLAPLLARGYEIGSQVLNFPPPDPNDTSLVEAEIPDLEPGDLVVVVTRPPLHDVEQEDRIKIARGHTTIEEKVFACARRAFRVLARSHVRLRHALAAELPPEHASRADMSVRVLQVAWYLECRGLDNLPVKRFRKGEYRTPAFLLRLNGVESLNGADLLMAFALGGTDTLVWARRLRTDFSRLLWRPGFTFVEMVSPDEIGRPERPVDLDFAHKWAIEEVMHVADVPA